MKNVFLLLIILISNSVTGQVEKYTISQDNKYKFTFINNHTGKEIFKGCVSVEFLKGDFSNTDTLYKRFVLIENVKNSFILFDIINDTILFKKKVDKIFYSELGDNNNYARYYQVKEQEKALKSALTKEVILFYFEEKGKEVYLLINVKTLKQKWFNSIDNITYNNDRSLIKIYNKLLYSSSNDGLRYTSVILLDNNFRVINPNLLWDVREFNKGFICSKSKYYGVIDKTGSEIIPFVFKELQYTFSKYFIARDTLDNVGIIDIHNNTVVPFEFRCLRYNNNIDECGDQLFSSEGVFVLKKSNTQGDFEFVDTNNVILVTTGTYLSVSIINIGVTDRFFFIEGKNGLSGIYDTKLKKELFPCEYKFKSNKLFKDSLIGCEKNGRWGLLNLYTGATVIPFNYDLNNVKFIADLNSFFLKKEGSMGIYSIDGKILIPFEYDFIEQFPSNLILVKKNGLYGLLNSITYEIILPCEYTNITRDFNIEKIIDNKLMKGTFSPSGIIRWKE